MAKAGSTEKARLEDAASRCRPIGRDRRLGADGGTDAPICQDGIVKVNRLEPGRKAS